MMSNELIEAFREQADHENERAERVDLEYNSGYHNGLASGLRIAANLLEEQEAQE